MAYKFKYNERPRSYSEEKHGDEDIPSAKAVRDTAVEERDDKIIKAADSMYAAERTLCSRNSVSEERNLRSIL